MNNDHGKNGNGKERQDTSNLQDRRPSPAELPPGVQRLENEVSELKEHAAALTLIVSEHLKAAADTSAEIKSLTEGFQTLQLFVDKVLLPLAEQNRQLRDGEVDVHILSPVVLGIARIIDRQSAEMTPSDQKVLEFCLIDEARNMDREEHLQLLSELGVEQIGAKRGAKFDPKFHTITDSRASADSARIGRVITTLRPGYVRSRDGRVFRKACVSVWTSPQ